MPWAARLLSVACVSVAAKMEECRAPALSEFDAGGGYEFCSESIRRMELLVLSTLGWRMGAVTPFDYLPCFASRLHQHDGGDHGGARVALKAIGFIFAAAEGSSLTCTLILIKITSLFFLRWADLLLIGLTDGL
jgi:cyclin D5, plant